VNEADVLEPLRLPLNVDVCVPAVITVVGAEPADAEPELLPAVTTARIVSPLSALVSE
jgi:hypothetical protein